MAEKKKVILARHCRQISHAVVVCSTSLGSIMLESKIVWGWSSQNNYQSCWLLVKQCHFYHPYGLILYTTYKNSESGGCFIKLLYSHYCWMINASSRVIQVLVTSPSLVISYPIYPYLSHSWRKHHGFLTIANWLHIQVSRWLGFKASFPAHIVHWCVLMGLKWCNDPAMCGQTHSKVKSTIWMLFMVNTFFLG